MLALVSTTINPSASDLLFNIDKFSSDGLNSYIVLDRKNIERYDKPFINFRDVPQSEYEFLCGFDTYSRKNIGFIRAFHNGENVFETDDDNRLIRETSYLTALLGDRAVPCFEDDMVNIFQDLYGDNELNVWARGFPIDKIHTTKFTKEIGSVSKPIGVYQFMIDGNPDVDAIFRLVKKDVESFKCNDNFLPLNLFNTFHPFNSQGTLWPREFLKLAYLPETCPFRMTDIWRGYVAQNILYKHDYAVSFQETALVQRRNIHNIAQDFFGEHSGYIQVNELLNTLSGIKVSSIEDMLVDSYLALSKIGIFDHKRELPLLECYLKSFEEKI